MNPVQRAADTFIVWAFDVDPSRWSHTPWLYAAAMLAVALLVLTFFALFAGPVTWVERRMAGRIQARVGPNRVGPSGSLQWLADGIKSLLKEDLVPNGADRPLFCFAPYLA